MRLISLPVLFLSCTVFGSTYQECLESIEKVRTFFYTAEFSSHIFQNDVFAVLGRIPAVMEITLYGSSPLTKDKGKFTKIGSDSICNIGISEIPTSAIVMARDKALTPKLIDIMLEKYYPGLVVPKIHCAGAVEQQIELCCVYDPLPSKRPANPHSGVLIGAEAEAEKASHKKAYNFDNPPPLQAFFDSSPRFCEFGKQ